MIWLIIMVTGSIVLTGCFIEYGSYWLMDVPMRPAGWVMLIVLPLLIAPPLLYVMLDQFQKLDLAHQELFISEKSIQLALAEVKDLKGLLSMCAGCKKVRNAEAEWVNVDSYLKSNTNAEISHGYCPDCASSFLSAK